MKRGIIQTFNKIKGTNTDLETFITFLLSELWLYLVCHSSINALKMVNGQLPSTMVNYYYAVCLHSYTIW